MRYQILFFILFCLSHFVMAQTDLSFGAQGRSFPLTSGEAFAEAGYNFKFWEKDDSRFKVNPFFGLIRPSIGINSSVVVNSLKAELEFFPISFVGFSTGYQKVESNFDFQFFDCDKIFCQLQLERRWIEGKMALKYQEALIVTSYKLDNINASRSGKNFGEFRRVIQGQDGGDKLKELRVVVARNWDQKLLGIVHEWAMFENSRQDSRTTFAAFQIKKEKNSYMSGIGTLESDEVGRGPIIYFRWVHQIYPSMKLF